MIRYLFLLLMLVLAAACEEEVESFNDLSTSEQEAIRRMSATKCINSSTSSFNRFISGSNENLSELHRGDHWKIEFSKGSTVQRTDYMFLWKKDGDKYYFLHQKDNGDGHTFYFYKITKNFNAAMIDDVMDKKCLKTFPVSNSSSSIAIKREDVSSYEPPTKYESNYSHSLKSSWPAFFGNYSYTQAKKKLDDDNEVVSTENYTYKISYINDDADLEDSYTDYSAQYCLFNYVDNTSDASDPDDKDLVFPYTTTCVTAATGPTNPGTDTTLDFVPSSEL